MWGLMIHLNRCLHWTAKRTFFRAPKWTFRKPLFYFVGNLQQTNVCCCFLLICVERLTGRLNVSATKRLTAETFGTDMRENTSIPFGPLEISLSDNRTCFATKGRKKFERGIRTNWLMVVYHGPVSNGGAEQMIVTDGRCIGRLVVNSQRGMGKCKRSCCFGYCHRPLCDGYFLFELCLALANASSHLTYPQVSQLEAKGIDK